MYQQAGILISLDAKVAEFFHIQFPKLLVDNPKDFPSIGRIPEAMLNLVLVSNHVLIQYREMMVEFSRVPTPKKSKASLNEVVIKEPTSEEQLHRKMKATGVLKTFSNKNLATNPLP